MGSLGLPPPPREEQDHGEGSSSTCLTISKRLTCLGSTEMICKARCLETTTATDSLGLRLSWMSGPLGPQRMFLKYPQKSLSQGAWVAQLVKAS